jgi:hypothetical protein
LEDITLFHNPGTLFHNPGILWGYGFHSSCWTLLLARLSHIEKQKDIVTSVFNLLYITPCPDFSYFQFGHDYGGAAGTHKPYGLPQPIDLSSPLYADPWEIPSLGELEKCAPEIHSFASPKQKVALDPHTFSSQGLGCPICRLPLELLYLVLSYLSLAQVAKIRLVCREFSLIAKPENLPQSFWRSRFRFGYEQDYILPDLSIKWDWSRLFRGTKSCLKGNNAPLINRKRIWTLLDPLAVLMEREESKKLLGSPFSIVGVESEQHQSPNNDLPTTYIAIRTFCGQLTSDSSDQLTEVCRLQRCSIAKFQSRAPKDGAQIQLSTVQIGAARYISGMQWVRPQSSGDLLSGIGIFTHSAKETINIPSSSVIKTVEVAFCTSGLVGIRFHFTKNGISQWVGQGEGEGIARGILQLPKDSEAFYLAAGTDVCDF